MKTEMTPEARDLLIPETVEQALRIWHTGMPLFSAEMGGLGPGYEQCIHELAFRVMEELSPECPELFTRADREGDTWKDTWQSEYEPRVMRLMEAMPEPFRGLSGAQYGAACNLALCVLRKGYRAALKELPSERLIQVNKLSRL